MKFILIILIFFLALTYAYDNQQEEERFYFVKCMVYLIISSIHSVIVAVKLPLGAYVIGIFYLFDKKNRKIKLRMLLSGIFIVIIWTLSFISICNPFLKMKLSNVCKDLEKIEVYTNTKGANQYLYTIEDTVMLKKWIPIIENSKPYSDWQYKIIPDDTGYMLKLYGKKDSYIIISNASPLLPNMFLDKVGFSYTNNVLIDLIESLYSREPSMLKIDTQTTIPITITDKKILNLLWDEILWNKPLPSAPNENLVFDKKSRLILEDKKDYSFSLSNDFTHVKLPSKQTIELSAYLKNTLYEQYILSQLETVPKFTKFEPAHIHTQELNDTVQYGIERDENAMFYGLYSFYIQDNKKVLLHPICSPHAHFFILKSPYILLLDEKAPSQYDLLLINQNLPNKHRYIEKGKNILPNSIAICPQNAKFSYTIQNASTTTLYLVSDYYQPPIPIASGNVLDSLFLSNQYIVFSMVLDNRYMLCIYDTTLAKTIKYIPIPGDIHIIKVENDCVYFAVQSKNGSHYKEAIFSINTNLKVSKVIFPSIQKNIS